MYLVVGCGLSGVTIAERIATVWKEPVTIIEKRDHIGGNCYDYIDEPTEILISKYGAHLFHTNSERVWKYVTSFDDWVRWEHKVLARVDDRLVSMPVNITTVNELTGENLQTEEEMNEWLKNNQVKYEKIENSEQMAKSRIGETLYKKLVKEYTFKQWNRYPEELDASVLARIPIRNNFDTRYFSDKYQALPKDGYTSFIAKILDNPLITVKLNTDFNKFDTRFYKKIFYTGPIDAYFQNMYESLEYRSIDFKVQRMYDIGYFQPNSVVNYPQNDIDYTRIVEYKHFLHQRSPHTVIVSETTNDNSKFPYYPIPNERNKKLYEKYKELALLEKDVYFIGRLANYKYFNMDQAILNALEFFDSLNE